MLKPTSPLRLALAALALTWAACRGDELPAPDVAPPAPAPIPTSGPPPEARLDEARKILQGGDVKKARALLEALAIESPIDGGVWTALAVARLADKDLRPAVLAAQRAVDLDSRNPEAYVTGGAALRATGDLARAEKLLLRALELDPKLAAARWNLAGIAADRGELPKEAEHLDALLASDPDNTQARFARAQNALRQKDPTKAREVALSLVERVPSHLEAQRLLAAMAWDAADYRESFERSKIAVRLGGDSDVSARLLEASFYVLAGARLACELGPRPWDARAMLPVLQRVEKEEDLSGAGAFADLDERYAADAGVQARITATAAKLCPSGPGAAPKTP